MFRSRALPSSRFCALRTRLELSNQAVGGRDPLISSQATESQSAGEVRLFGSASSLKSARIAKKKTSAEISGDISSYLPIGLLVAPESLPIQKKPVQQFEGEQLVDGRCVVSG